VTGSEEKKRRSPAKFNNQKLREKKRKVQWIFFLQSEELKSAIKISLVLQTWIHQFNFCTGLTRFFFFGVLKILDISVFFLSERVICEQTYSDCKSVENRILEGSNSRPLRIRSLSTWLNVQRNHFLWLKSFSFFIIVEMFHWCGNAFW